MFTPIKMKIEDIRCAFKNRIYCGRIQNVDNVCDPFEFLNMCQTLLNDKIGEFLFNNRSGIKINMELACEYIGKYQTSLIL